MHSQFFVCKLINAATAPTEEQLSEGGLWLAEGDTQVVLLLWSMCRVPYACMECPCASPYDASGREKKAWTQQKAFTDWKVHSLGVFSTSAHAL